MARGPATRPGVQAVLLTIALCLALAPSLPAQEKTEPKAGFGPLEKSLLIPGWGQLSEKRYVKRIALPRRGDRIAHRLRRQQLPRQRELRPL